MEDLRIVRGNDFYLKVPVSRVIFKDDLDGSKKRKNIPMPLDECTDVKVNLVDEGGDMRMPLQFTINELVYNISEANGDVAYDDLADALGTNGENVPDNKRKPYMSMKYKACISEDIYNVAIAAASSVPEPALNVHQLDSPSEVGAGERNSTYMADYTEFSTLPVFLNAREIYYYIDPLTDDITIWTIRKDYDASFEWHQYRYNGDNVMDDEAFVDTEHNWTECKNGEGLPEYMLIVKVYGRKIDLGWYGLEATGKYDGRDFRSYERKVFKIVENNGKSFVSGDTYEGEVSYQIDEMWTLYAQDSYPTFRINTRTMELEQYGVVENAQMSIDTDGNLVMNV